MENIIAEISTSQLTCELSAVGHLTINMIPVGSLTCNLSGINPLTAELNAVGSLECDLTIGSIGDVDVYTGPYEVTPSTSQQTLFTSGKTMAHNVTIAPIPNNYGLITWNGSTLTVS